MIEIGKRHTYFVDSEDSSGFYLICSEHQEVFMPGTLAPKGLKPGEKIEAFVFVNNQGDQIATGNMPLAEVGDFACLVVKDVTRLGAYLEIGLPKDLLVPRSVQKYEMRIGDVHLVKVMLEEGTQRMYGTEKIGEFIESAVEHLRPKQSISLVPFHRTPLGYKVLIEGKYLGVVYHNEIFQEVTLGRSFSGSVKAIRADGHVDALLQKVGSDALSDHADSVMSALEKSGGSLSLGDKSSPDEIRSALSMSKKAFKAAIGSLYKKRLISVGEGGISLQKESVGDTQSE